eukprot:560611-Alexandrium_andersonii.AAC.1
MMVAWMPPRQQNQGRPHACQNKPDNGLGVHQAPARRERLRNAPLVKNMWRRSGDSVLQDPWLRPSTFRVPSTNAQRSRSNACLGRLRSLIHKARQHLIARVHSLDAQSVCIAGEQEVLAQERAVLIPVREKTSLELAAFRGRNDQRSGVRFEVLDTLGERPAPLGQPGQAMVGRSTD